MFRGWVVFCPTQTWSPNTFDNFSFWGTGGGGGHSAQLFILDGRCEQYFAQLNPTAQLNFLFSREKEGGGIMLDSNPKCLQYKNFSFSGVRVGLTSLKVFGEDVWKSMASVH